MVSVISPLPLEDPLEATGSLRKWWSTEPDTWIRQSPSPQEDDRVAGETGVHTA